MDDLARLLEGQMTALNRARFASSLRSRGAYLDQAESYATRIEAALARVAEAVPHAPYMPRIELPPAKAPPAPRLRFSRPLSCGCGWRGSAVFEEDDVSDRPQGGRNVALVSIAGPFLRDERGRFVCRMCDATAPAA